MRPITFDGCFGWIHAPQGLRANVGVVLISAIGRDERCAHLPSRLFAERLAQAGYPALRYDHLGEGDSLSLPDAESDALPLWLAGVQQAIDKLRKDTGVQQVVLAGVRLGASLAAVSAAKADGLILLAPVLDGGPWLKRMQFASQVAKEANRSAYLDTGGLVLSTATMASLSRLKLVEAPEVPVFVAAQNRLVETYAAELAQRGTPVTVTDFPGFDALFLDAHSNFAPDAVFDRACRWLAQTFGDASITNHEGDAGPPAVLQSPGALERPVEFGARLHGIICDPEGTSASAAVIFCNTGGDPRAGIGGFATMAARRLANLGFASLRFDFAGLGDSPIDGPEPRTHVYEVSRTADLEAAVDLMAARGAKRVAVVGVCAGAYHAFESAMADPRVTDLIAVSPVKLNWRRGDSLSPGRIDDGKSTQSYVQALTNSATWTRLITGKVDVVAVFRTISVRARERAEGWLARRRSISPFSKMRRFSTRGGRALFLMGLDDGSPDQMAIHFGHEAGRLKRMSGAAIQIEPNLDHGLARQESRQIALAALVDWLGGSTGSD